MLISIVTPTLNEAANIGARAADLAAQGGPYEWIVADGGSSDETVALALAHGARVVEAPRGRGRQLDAGAQIAHGDVLLFLHADTVLPPGALDRIRAVLHRPGYVGGNFALRFDERGVAAHVFAWIYATQQLLVRAYFGDSAIFARRDTYRRIGGFGNAPIMEDYAFVRRLERAGRVVRIREAVVTSSRRYRGRPLRTLALWMTIMALYRLGVPPRRLARLYPAHRDAQQHPPPS